jgi:hypothetical protein
MMPAVPPGAPFRASYIDYFQNAAHDSFNGEYAAALAPYDVPLAQNVPAAFTPDTIRTLVIGARAQKVPTAFLLHHDEHLHVYLQVDKYHARLGLPPTQWDDRMFAQKGDLHRNQAVLVEWKADYFHQLPQQILVPTPVTIDTVFATEPAAILLGPYAQGEPGTELIKVRRTCFVPPKYVPLFLGAPLTPREAWERVRGQIVIDGQQVACLALIKYLQAALTRQGAGAAPALALTEAPVPPLADSLLLDHRQRILEEDFPELADTQARAQQNLIADRLGELVQENRSAREQERAEKEQEKTKDPKELLGDVGVQKLLRWGHVSMTSELPAVWKELVKAKKAQQLAVLQWAVDKAKDEMGETELQFVISPAVLELVKNLRFVMLTPNHVATGLQPFQFPEEAIEGTTSAQALYQAIYTGTGAPPMTEVANILQAKPGAPKVLYQARHQVRRTYILLVVLLGEEHGLCVAYERFYQRFLAAEAELHRYQQGLATTHDQLLFPTKLLKRNAIDLSYWFEMQATTPTMRAAPRFEQVFESIKQEHTHWEPQMSASFLRELKLDGFQKEEQIKPNETPGAKPIEKPTPLDNTTASNPHFLEDKFGKYRQLRSVSTRSIRRKIAEKALPPLPPSKVDKQPMCLAWHTKGQCNVRCPRAVDHVAYQASELQELITWCASHYPRE